MERKRRIEIERRNLGLQVLTNNVKTESNYKRAFSCRQPNTKIQQEDMEEIKGTNFSLLEEKVFRSSNLFPKLHNPTVAA